MTTFVNANTLEFANGIRFGLKNEVISFDPKGYPSLANLARGMILRSINGVPVLQAEKEQRRCADTNTDMLLVFVSECSPQHDEFDLSSGDDEDGAFQHPKPGVGILNGEDDSSLPMSVELLHEVVERAGPGKCIIIMSDGVNPAFPIAMAAERASCTLMHINTVARLKTRQSLEQAGEFFRKSLEKGLWILIEQATKSISLLRKLAECIMEAERAGTVHNKARIFLICEPHPHFPEVLLKGGVTLRSTLSRDTGVAQLENDLLESKGALPLVRGSAMAAVPGDAKPLITKESRRVKISYEVNIVPLEKSDFMEMSQSATPSAERENIPGEGITRVAKYTFSANEKFISLCKVGEGRYAVGTTGGYILILDVDGLPLIQFRPHKACVWDLAFASTYNFATACEDGTSTIFNYSLAGQGLTATSVASFQSDVFAVTYADENDANSAVLSGGLNATICILHSDRQSSSFVASGASVQAMRATQRRFVLVGGGSGICSLVDPATCTIIETTDRHQRKVPAVACYGDTAVTGGFDKFVRVWDVRSGIRPINERTMSEVITAVAVDDKHICACSGTDLWVWDVRKLSFPLTSKKNAWKDLTRGLAIDGDIIITAAADGVASFWSLGSFSD